MSADKTTAGDEDDKERFEILTETIAASHRNQEALSLTEIARRNLATTRERSDKRFNPHDGERNSWQLHETAEAFLQRAPPRTASGEEYGPWLWVFNPFAGNPKKSVRIASFKEEAGSALDEFLKAKESLEKSMAGRSASAITKKISPRRKEAEQAILQVATKHGVTSGKWMLFLLPEDIDEYWKAVVEGTITGDLGTSAKVATDEGQGDRMPRLICIYTKNFADVEDVRRVVLELNRRGLVKNIYYKSGTSPSEPSTLVR